jgi:hypothetical protein
MDACGEMPQRLDFRIAGTGIVNTKTRIFWQGQKNASPRNGGGTIKFEYKGEAA